MFIRVKKIGPYEYLYLVENAREGGRHVQRVIKALGRRDAIENSDLLDGLIVSAARPSRRSIVLSSFYRGERRWCMNTVWVASPPQACVLFDTDGDRHAEAGHSVERVAGDFRLGLLIGQSPGMQTPADDRLVAIHRRLHEASPAI